MNLLIRYPEEHSSGAIIPKRDLPYWKEDGFL